MRRGAGLRLTKTHDMDASGPGPVEQEVVELAAMVIVEGNGVIRGGFEIEASNSLAFVHWDKIPS